MRHHHLVADVHDAIAQLWKREAPRLIGSIARLVRDVGLAEELAQDALVSALEQWPRDGIPSNPGAWLTAAARHRAIDVLRRGSFLAARHDALAHELDQAHAPDVDGALDAVVRDDVLRLIFVACHPVLPEDARVALTLRMLGGLTTPEIARAFLVPEATVAQRIVRAKKLLADARVPFEVPDGDALAERLGSVMGVLYLIFNEGYSASTGDDPLRPALTQEALRLTRLLADVDPGEPEVHGLLALMELQSSRAAARLDAEGNAVTLLEQDRTRWDRAAIDRGFGALARAHALGGALGLYTLQASIAACHARAARAEDTDWGDIAARYDVLAARLPTAVVQLNRAVAHAMVFGPQAGLTLLEPLVDELSGRGYHLVHTVRGDLLERLDRHAEAAVEFERAAAMTDQAREKAVLLGRASRATSMPSRRVDFGNSHSTGD